MLGHRDFKPRWVALPADPAIDKYNAKECEKLGFNFHECVKAGHITLHEGQTCTLFKIMPVETKQRRVLAAFPEGQDGMIERADYALRAGLLAVKGWQVQSDDGDIVEQEWTLERKDYGRHGTCCSLEAIQGLPLHMGHVVTLAGMVWQISEAGPFVSPPSEPPHGPTEP
jgi:hypothetical protein